jgi:hypothetical protein
MSTKSTIAYGPTFHLYHEALDEDFIYLELEGVAFEASYNRVMVPIPVHIWEIIRQYPGVDLTWAEKSDEEIRAYVEREVDERIQRYTQEENPRVRGLLAVFGAIVFGTVDMPREEQITQGMSYFMKQREHQQQIKRAIEGLEQANRRRGADR